MDAAIMMMLGEMPKEGISPIFLLWDNNFFEKCNRK